MHSSRMETPPPPKARPLRPGNLQGMLGYTPRPHRDLLQDMLRYHPPTPPVDRQTLVKT